MSNQEELKTIKSIVRDFFEKMTFQVEADFSESEDNIYLVSIRTSEPQILIGQNGQTLFEIQHILKAILRKKFGSEIGIDIDVNGYKKKKIEYLKEIARSAADEVSLLNKEKTLSAMTSYERRIIHTELTGRSDVITESVGMEPDRKIVVKPKTK
jgi:spoIIIJ-associated protein